MPEQGPDILKGSYNENREKDRFGERVSFNDFEPALKEVKFDAEEMKRQMYDALRKSQSNAFSVVKFKVGEKLDPDDFEMYIDCNGGNEFLEMVFNQGLKALGQDFKVQQGRFARYIDIIRGGKVAREKVPTHDENGQLIYKTRAEVLKGSGLEARLFDVAKSIGKEPVGLTFEDAFDNGFYNEYFQPTMLGVAEYGLTWLEYRSRQERANMDAMKSRRGVEEPLGDAAAKTVEEKPKEAKAEEAPKAKKLSQEPPKERDGRFTEKETQLLMYRDILKKMVDERMADFEGVKVEEDKGRIGEIQIEDKKADIYFPVIKFSRNGQLIFSIQVDFDKNGDVVYLLRDPRQERDVEFSVRARSLSSARGDMVRMLWYASSKLRHPNDSERELNDRLEAETGVNGVRYYSTRAEASKARDIIYDEDSKTWKPREGFVFVDKSKNSSNYAIEIAKNEQADLKRYAEKIFGGLQDRVADYSERGALGLEAGSRVYRDRYGYPEVSVYQGQAMLLSLKVYSVDDEVKYRVYLGEGKFADYDDYDEMMKRIDNVFKKRVKIDDAQKKVNEEAEFKKRAMESTEVKLMSKPYRKGVEGFRQFAVEAFGEILGSGFVGNLARQGYFVDETGAVYKVELSRVRAGEKDYKIRYKLFVGTKREQSFDSSISFAQLHQQGRRGINRRDDFANEMRNKMNELDAKYREANVPAEEYLSSVKQAREELKLDKK